MKTIRIEKLTVKGVEMTLHHNDLLVDGFAASAAWMTPEDMYRDVCAAFKTRGTGIAESCYLAIRGMCPRAERVHAGLRIYEGHRTGLGA